MCITCGCATDTAHIDGAPVDQPPHHGHSHGHSHDHAHHHGHGQAQTQTQPDAHDHAPLNADASSPGSRRMVQIEQDILAKNNAYAAANRASLAARGIFALNLVSSPGSGKTTLLCRTISQLGAQAVAVIEGDQQTSFDAERIRATGAPAVQINTGKGCHLDAHMVGHALQQLALPDAALLLIENVGNLVCPAAFDLGEAHKVVILSVTEGEDKPLKYPDMFRAASVLLLNKIDLLPYVSFDVDAAIAYARRVNPQIQVIELSASSGQGMEQWLDFLHAGQRQAAVARQQTVQSLQQRIAQLEAALARQSATAGAAGS